jgi:hypothetical protein
MKNMPKLSSLVPIKYCFEYFYEGSGEVAFIGENQA